MWANQLEEEEQKQLRKIGLRRVELEILTGCTGRCTFGLEFKRMFGVKNHRFGSPLLLWEKLR